MKLTKSINRRIEKEVYYKYIITVPQKILEELKWDEDSNLEFIVDGKELRIKKK